MPVMPWVDPGPYNGSSAPQQPVPVTSGDTYWVSFARSDTPQAYELYSAYKTKAEADKAAQDIRAWAARTGWKVADIKIEKEAGPAKPATASSEKEKPSGALADLGAMTPLLSQLRDLGDRVMQAKKAVDKAREILDKGLVAKERQLGDTLKEYGQAVAKAYDYATRAKRELTSLTGSISEREFKRVNSLIDTYNRHRVDLGASQSPPLLSPPLRLPGISRVRPGQMKASILPDQPGPLPDGLDRGAAAVPAEGDGGAAHDEAEREYQARMRQLEQLSRDLLAAGLSRERVEEIITDLEKRARQRMQDVKNAERK
jgi:hypothetical protein